MEYSVFRGSDIASSSAINVEGRPLELDAPGRYAVSEASIGGWVVDNLDTGHRFAMGATKASAIRSAKRKAARYGEDELRKKIRRIRRELKKHGKQL